MKTIQRWLGAAVAVLVLAAPAAAQGTLTQKQLTASGSDCSVSARCAMYDMTNIASLGIDLDVGASGTFQFEVSQDSTNGVNGRWGSTTNTAGDSSVTADGRYYFVNLGYRWLRVRASAISGTAVVRPARGYGAGATGAAGGAGDASAANQDEQTALLTTINAATEALSALVDAMANALTTTLVDSSGTAIPVGDAGSGSVTSNTSRVVAGNLDTPVRIADSDETADEIDDDPGVLCGFRVRTANTSPVFLQIFYADLDDVTVGTTAPDDVIDIPEAAASGSLSGTFPMPNGCVAYSNLTIATTTTPTGSTGPAANVAVTVFKR